MTKSFADWTQEIAERNNHEPEPKRRSIEEKIADLKGMYGAPYNPPPKRGDFSADEDTDQHIACSGDGCTRFGEPNYSSNGWDVDQYYCGHSDRCMP